MYGDGFDKAVETFLEDGVITEAEEQKISSFKNHTKLSNSVLDKNGAIEKIVKALILRDIFEGKICSRLNISGKVPFIFQKDETLLWLFQDAEFYEQRNKTVYQGRTQGVSIKIAKGVYYRTGSFKGTPVISSQLLLIGKGVLALTNKNLYFASQEKTFKTQYSKLISLTPYSDGIGIQKDGASAKPQVFKDIDGWFSYNLISNLTSV